MDINYNDNNEMYGDMFVYDKEINEYYSKNIFLQGNTRLIMNELQEAMSQNSENINNKIKIQAIESKEIIMKLMCDNIKIVLKYGLEKLIGKEEYDDEIQKLKKYDDDTYIKYRDYIVEIHCKIIDLSLIVLGEVLITSSKSEMNYEKTQIKTQQLAENIIEDISECIDCNRAVSKSLLTVLLIQTMYKTYEVYNEKTEGYNNTKYKSYLESYKGSILELNTVPQRIKNKIKKQIDDTIKKDFPKIVICSLETNMNYYANSVSRVIMNNIIKVCNEENLKDNKYISNYKYLDEEYEIIIDLNNLEDCKKIEIKDLHKKIFIYMCSLMYEEDKENIKVEYKKIIKLIDNDNRTEIRNNIKNKIKELNCIYCNEIKNGQIIKRYKLLEIDEINKEYIKIRMGNWIFGNLRSNVSIIDKVSLRYKDITGKNIVGGAFTLSLALSDYMILNKDKYNAVDKDGWFKIEAKDVLIDLIGYNENNKNSFFEEKVEKLQKYFEDKNSNLKLHFKNAHLEPKEVFDDYIKFKNNDLLKCINIK